MNIKIDDSYWLRIATTIGYASSCRVGIGTVLIKNRKIVGTGFVGSISGDNHCSDVGCLMVENYGIQGSSSSGKSCIRTIHSELNAILHSKERGDTDGWLECYTTYQPCLSCLKALLTIGVRKIVFEKPYKDIWRDEYIKESYLFKTDYESDGRSLVNMYMSP
jgi:dCMP deaminase